MLSLLNYINMDRITAKNYGVYTITETTHTGQLIMSNINRNFIQNGAGWMGERDRMPLRLCESGLKKHKNKTRRPRGSWETWKDLLSVLLNDRQKKENRIKYHTHTKQLTDRSEWLVDAEINKQKKKRNGYHRIVVAVECTRTCISSNL